MPGNAAKSQQPPLPPPPPGTLPPIIYGGMQINTTSVMMFPPTQGSSSSGGSSTYTRFFFVAITCLCLVASFVVFLHLYLRYIRRRHIQRHRRHTVDLFRLTAFTNTHSDAPRAGLDRAAISSIPSFQYHKEAHNSSESSTVTTSGADECAVCLSLLEEGEVARMLPACRHAFHLACIDKWLSSSASCPVCRAEVHPQTQVQGRTRPQSLSQSQSQSQSQLAVVEVTDAPVQDQSTMKEEAEDGGSVSTRFSSSFRRMLSGDRSSTRRVQDDSMVDLERGNGANSNN